MADLGTIQGFFHEEVRVSRAQPSAGIKKPWLCTGSITGSVTVLGVLAADILVLLYERDSFRPLRSTRTNAAGVFTFSELYPGIKYFAIAFDPDGGTQYNAIIFDKITPV